MMRFPKMVISNEQNAKVFSQSTYDDFITVLDRQLALRKPQHLLGYFQHHNIMQTAIQKSLRQQLISEHLKGGRKQ
jgi:hypothetical protein